MVASGKLTLGTFATIKGASASNLLLKDHLPDELPLEAVPVSGTSSSDISAVEQPLLMAKADIEIGEPASGAVVSDADVAYTDHISSDVAEIVSDQPELVAMNTVQHLTNSAVLADENATGGGGIPWMWMGAAAIAGGGLGVAFGANHGGNDAVPVAAPVDPTVHVVVERFGAFIDTDKDGMKDLRETTAAVFSEGENADLVNDAVVVHFNNVPLDAIDLTGFTEDDKVRFDVGSLQDHHLLNTSSNSITGLEITSENGNDYTYFQFTNDPSISLLRYRLSGSAKGFNNDPHHDMYALQAYSMEKSVNGHNTGVIAYWDDPGNALNFQANVLQPLYTNNNTDEIRSNLNDSTATHGLVEFVWPADEEHIDVIVQYECVSIDLDHDGVMDACEWNCTATFDSDSPGTFIDLANSDVTIHFHGLPASPLDLSGFTANDMIEIDMNALDPGGPDFNITRHDQTTVNATFMIKNGVTVYATQSHLLDGTIAIACTASSSHLKLGAAYASYNASITIADFAAYNPLNSGNVVFVVEML
jgi:hypothetical protein